MKNGFHTPVRVPSHPPTEVSNREKPPLVSVGLFRLGTKEKRFTDYPVGVKVMQHDEKAEMMKGGGDTVLRFPDIYLL